MAKVYVKFPKTGLGNLMLVWAKALVFARTNDLELITSSWFAFRWGAIFRRETKKRLYWNYFTCSPFLIRNSIKAELLFTKMVKEPPIEKLSADVKMSNTIFMFNKPLTSDRDLFRPLRGHRDLIREELYKILTPANRERLSKLPAPQISVHIRRGDFKFGNPITPNEYFINGIKIIRETLQCNWPVTVFTDAQDQEIQDVLNLPNMHLAANNPDILDILLLSKSKIMLLSQSSTFSYWGAFLSDALVIIPEDDWQLKLRDDGKAYQDLRWDSTSIQSTARLTEILKSNYIHECQE